MCKALNDAMVILEGKTLEKCKSFVYTVRSDGDPRPIAEVLRSMGVFIVTCFLTSDPIPNPKTLL